MSVLNSVADLSSEELLELFSPGSNSQTENSAFPTYQTSNSAVLLTHSLLAIALLALI